MATKTATYTAGISGSILAILYAALLVYNLRLRTFGWMTVTILLLLLSQVCLVWSQFTIVYITDADGYEWSAYNWFGSTLEGTGFGTFLLAHFILAFKYQAISIEVPQMLEGEVKEEQSLFAKITYWFLLVLNVLSGPFYTVTAGIFFTNYIENKDVKHSFAGLKTAASFIIAFCAIASGVILMAGVRRINQYFKDKNAVDCINTRRLTLHSVAFGLFLLSVVLWAVGMFFYDSQPTEGQIDKAIDDLFVVIFSIALIAELFLIEVLYRWSSDSPDDMEPVERFKTLSVASSDFELDLQRRIWNALVNKRLASIEAGRLTLRSEHQ